MFMSNCVSMHPPAAQELIERISIRLLVHRRYQFPPPNFNSSAASVALHSSAAFASLKKKKKKNSLGLPLRPCCFN